MASSHYLPPRPWTQRKDSFSSLAGLEIAIPPGHKAPISPGASLHSEYSDKALPPIPQKSTRRSRLSYQDMDRDDISSLTSRTSKSSRKVFQLMGVHVDTDTKDPPRSQSRSQSRLSVSTLESEYSEDDIDDDYSTTPPPPSVTPPPRRLSSDENPKALNSKALFYLQVCAPLDLSSFRTLFQLCNSIRRLPTVQAPQKSNGKPQNLRAFLTN